MTRVVVYKKQENKSVPYSMMLPNGGQNHELSITASCKSEFFALICFKILNDLRRVIFSYLTQCFYTYARQS
jgi:hypothetical protein